ncbi:M23 family metallopeptidase [Bacteroidota bacterium]
MKTLIKYLWILLLVSIQSCDSSSSRNEKILDDSKIFSLGHKYTAWFLSHELDSLIECIHDKKYTINHLQEFRERVKSQIGGEVKLLNERIVKGKSDKFFYYYVRYSKFDKINQPVKTIFSFDNNDNIFVFSVEALPEEAQSKYHYYETKTKLSLPFKGEWHVSQGGRNINHNQHAVAVDQRFAYDFLIKRDKFTYENDGSKNEDYFCFNKEILAPGTGIIVKILNDIDDSLPGEMPEIPGNYVIINHGNNEYSVLAHFKKGSIVVKPGDEVKIGQLLSYCGNSGHSSQAHLHYHLQNSPVIFEGEGLPAKFQSYNADGEFIERGEPFWDQEVKNKIDE